MPILGGSALELMVELVKSSAKSANSSAGGTVDIFSWADDAKLSADGPYLSYLMFVL